MNSGLNARASDATQGLPSVDEINAALRARRLPQMSEDQPLGNESIADWVEVALRGAAAVRIGYTLGENVDIGWLTGHHGCCPNCRASIAEATVKILDTIAADETVDFLIGHGFEEEPPAGDVFDIKREAVESFAQAVDEGGVPGGACTHEAAPTPTLSEVNEALEDRGLEAIEAGDLSEVFGENNPSLDEWIELGLGLDAEDRFAAAGRVAVLLKLPVSAGARDASEFAPRAAVMTLLSGSFSNAAGALREAGVAGPLPSPQDLRGLADALVEESQAGAVQ